MIELVVLLISIVLMMYMIYNKQDITENFDTHYLKTCPINYKSFINTNGDIICHKKDDEVIANRYVNGTDQCTLNGKGTDEIPNCLKFTMDYYKTQGKKTCPRSMPNYFKMNNTEKCTSGRLNDTLSGPINGETTCTIYNSELDKTSKDSCYNQKRLDASICPVKQCKKSIIQQPGTKKVFIKLDYYKQGRPTTDYV